MLFLSIHLLVDFDLDLDFFKNIKVFFVTVAYTKMKLYFHQDTLFTVLYMNIFLKLKSEMGMKYLSNKTLKPIQDFSKNQAREVNRLKMV